MYSHNNEALCETDELGERLFSRDEMEPIGAEIGHRILDLFGFQPVSNIVFRLHSNRKEIFDVVSGTALPSGELLLAIKKVTGVSLDWLMTGQGAKFPSRVANRRSRPAIQFRHGPRAVTA